MPSMSCSFSKGTAGESSLKHNKREFTEKEFKEKFHEHIDQERTEKNRVIVQEDIQEAYKKIFGDAVKEYNAKQKRKDRKIKNYYRHVKSSKTLEVQREFVVQIGDKSDFSGLDDPKWQQANDMLERYLKGFQERNPNLHVFSAIIHNDEATPHMHMNLIPVAQGYKRGVSKQPSFNKALENLGYISPKEDTRVAFKEWRNREVEALESIMREQGYERKIVGTNDYKDVHDYKAAQREIDRQQERLNDRAKKALDYEKTLEIREKELDDREIELVKREKKIEQKETDVNKKESLIDKAKAKMNETLAQWKKQIQMQIQDWLDETKKKLEEYHSSDEYFAVKGFVAQASTELGKSYTSFRELWQDRWEEGEPTYDELVEKGREKEIKEINEHDFDIDVDEIYNYDYDDELEL
jgi:hypothetical protein